MEFAQSQLIDPHYNKNYFTNQDKEQKSYRNNKMFPSNDNSFESTISLNPYKRNDYIYKSMDSPV